MSKISYARLKKTLPPREMKNVTGGSTKWCRCDGWNQWVSCSTADDCDKRNCPDLGPQCY